MLWHITVKRCFAKADKILVEGEFLDYNNKPIRTFVKKEINDKKKLKKIAEIIDNAEYNTDFKFLIFYYSKFFSAMGGRILLYKNNKEIFRVFFIGLDVMLINRTMVCEDQSALFLDIYDVIKD